MVPSEDEQRARSSAVKMNVNQIEELSLAGMAALNEELAVTWRQTEYVFDSSTPLY